MLVEREGRVSVWVGRFAGEPALRLYVEASYDGDECTCPFWTDTGTDWLDEDFLEAAFHPDGLVPAQLVADHSYGRSFAAPVDAAVQCVPVDDANAVIVAYDVEYTPSPETPTGPVWFVGTFDYLKS
jgi:Immunity protein 22